MLNFSFVSLFIFILFFGTFFSLSSTHWFAVWFGLELNLMGFIPIMVQKSTMEETESGVKYFLIQAVGSGLFLFGVLLTSWDFSSWGLGFLGAVGKTGLAFFALLLKLGGAPFHFWVPSVAAGLSWLSNFLLLTWQKVAPLFMICCYLNLANYFLLGLVAMSSFFGGVGGVNQTSLRALIAYSSILHMGWLLAGASISWGVVFIYFFFYCIILFFISCLGMKEESLNMSQFSNIFVWKFYSRYCLVLMLLSLGGMPPFLGFFGKMLILVELLSLGNIVISIILILGSMISLYYYLVLSFSLLLSSSSEYMKSRAEIRNVVGFSMLVGLGGLWSLVWLYSL
uniref:NADH-ubiquinone oxidoreductase chain 2 n=1 Tax=Cryptochiton stelleri TaxID=6655 RepID=A0A0E3DEG3_CRYST|nr:NADH dehydrogenase subunit 2 [Cryptochiton stelleri]AIA77090.1 NADH dehydrogenase subunit 2 [Cryptochiton stelleri]